MEKMNTVNMDCFMDIALPMDRSALPTWQRKAIATTPYTPKKSTRHQRSCPKSNGDRFIPSRSGLNLDITRYKLMQTTNGKQNARLTKGSSKFQQSLEANLLANDSNNPVNRVLNFSNVVENQTPTHHNHAKKVMYSYHKGEKAKVKPYRHISSSPSRILDAPELRDDYYLNLLSWNSDKILAVALNQTVYLWNADTGSIDELRACSGPNDYVTSVSWIGQGGGSMIAVGTDSSEVQIWDAGSQKKLRMMSGHTGRIGSLAWNSFTLSSGSRDSTIFYHDVRAQRHHFATLRGHQQEVCGLSWSPDGTTLASGGNDNILCLWDRQARGSTHSPRHILTGHNAAVKALAWSPWERNLLASGGGTADRTIKFWNSANGSMLNSIDTSSQVCGLMWSKSEKELLSSHGFSQYQLCLWKYPTMNKVKELRGHTARVLHMAMSPDGSTVVSAAADETLRFWDVFPAANQAQKNPSFGENKYTSIAGIR